MQRLVAGLVSGKENKEIGTASFVHLYPDDSGTDLIQELADRSVLCAGVGVAADYLK